MMMMGHDDGGAGDDDDDDDVRRISDGTVDGPRQWPSSQHAVMLFVLTLPDPRNGRAYMGPLVRCRWACSSKAL